MNDIEESKRSDDGDLFELKLNLVESLYSIVKSISSIDNLHTAGTRVDINISD